MESLEGWGGKEVTRACRPLHLGLTCRKGADTWKACDNPEGCPTPRVGQGLGICPSGMFQVMGGVACVLWDLEAGKAYSQC